MAENRLLLLHDDPFLSRFYKAKLEEAGFIVDTAADVPTGLDRLKVSGAAIIVVDPLLRSEAAPDPVAALRAEGAGSQAPILALPTVHYSLAQNIETGGAAHLLTSETNTLGELLRVATEKLGAESTFNRSILLATLPDEDWRVQAIRAAQESLHRMRLELHQLMRQTSDTAALRNLLRTVHHLGEQSRLFNAPVLTRLTRAVELLVFMLDENPECVEPMALRTLSQAVDFITPLLDPVNPLRLPDIQDARVMLIEDEAPARELIGAAMELVGLQWQGAEKPSEGLAKLQAEVFDLIFLDLNLPEMNGFALCNKVRVLPFHERTPIVFLTGMNSFQNRVQSNLSGGNDFAGKPFNVAELGVKALIWVLKGRMGAC